MYFKIINFKYSFKTVGKYSRFDIICNNLRLNFTIIGYFKKCLKSVFLMNC